MTSIIRTKWLLSAGIALTAASTPLCAQASSADAPVLAVVATADAESIPAVRSATICIAKREPRAVAQLVSTTPFSAEEKKRAGKLLEVIDYCTNDDSVMRSSLRFRSAATEWLYEKEFGSPPSPRQPAAATGAILPASAANSPESAAFAPIFAAAQCAVAAKPEEVDAILDTEPSSDRETDAINGLGEVLTQCVGAGKIHTDRETLRGALAEALYRWSVVQRGGASSDWAAAAGGQDG